MNRAFSRSGFAARLAAAAAVVLLWGTAPASATHITFTGIGDDGMGDTSSLSGFIDVVGEGSNVSATAFAADFSDLPTFGPSGFEESALSYTLDMLISVSWYTAGNPAGPGFDSLTFSAFQSEPVYGDPMSVGPCGGNCVSISDSWVDGSSSFTLTLTSVTGAADVPEPASLALMLGGLAALGAARRKTPTV